MAKQWVVNNGTRAAPFFGVLLQPGEGTWVDVPPDPGPQVPADALTASEVAGIRSSGLSALTAAQVQAVQEATAAGFGAASVRSTGYHCHIWTPDQTNADRKLWDVSGQLNDAAFQANLSAATAWATAGFCTQPNPSVSGELSLIEVPALSWNWAAGDSLFVFWRGRLTPEAGDVSMLADTAGTAASGVKIMATAAGKVKVNLYQASGALSRFGGTSGGTCFEPSITHSFGLLVTGAGEQCVWVDGARDSAYSSGYAAISGGPVDTTSAVTLKLGGDGTTSSGIQNGPAMQTQALAILKGRRSLGAPAVAQMDALVRALHASPAALVSAAAW